jgi:hypothetical protein
MENGTNPYIKCGMNGVICMDRKGFDLFCGKLYGDRNPDVYRGLRNNIEKVIRDYHMEIDVKEIIGHICEMALCMATSKEGWYVDNHIAYLTTVARNRIFKLKKYNTSRNYTDIHLCEEFMAPGDAYKASENREIIQKSLEILKRRYHNDFLFIEGLKMGHYDNNELARYLGRENDAKFRKAKQRALDRMREVVLDVMGRGPDGFRMLSKNNSYQTDILMKNNLTFNIKYVTRDIQFEENNEKSSKLINFIFNGISMPDIQRTMKRISFRINALWLKDAA